MDVMPPINKDFYWHNRSTFFMKINPKLKDKYALSKFPYAELSLPKRAVKWMLNPGVFTRTYIQLEGKSFWHKLKIRLNEIRWRILQK
ncbi:MAG: hypothetical protein EBQ94_08105 [Flavobacteriales bacterium]|nr:hypothetical protein [Crocinitomicaceae bacterium]NBX80323.1 hypothetical protein [Flavobacteriales bacterium]